jgi:hypothetical protein
MTLQCGLDHARQGIAERPVQEQAFQQQLQLSKELQRPISVRPLLTFMLLPSELFPCPCDTVHAACRCTA